MTRAIALALLAFALAGCGGNGGGTTAAGTTATAPTTTTPTTTQSGGGGGGTNGSPAPAGVKVVHTDCEVNDAYVQDPLPISRKSTTPNVNTYSLSYYLMCKKPPPGGPLKNVDSDIKAHAPGGGTLNALMPSTDSTGHTHKFFPVMPSRYVGSTVDIEVDGDDGNTYVIGTTTIPPP